MKPALIAAITLAVAICLAPRSESKQRPTYITAAAQQENPTAVTPLITNEKANANDQARNNQSPSGDATPQWILIIVTAITAAFICWQAWETARAAKATEKAAEAATSARRSGEKKGKNGISPLLPGRNPKSL